MIDDLGIAGHRMLAATCAAAWNLSLLEKRAVRDPSSGKDALERARTDIGSLGLTGPVQELKKRKELLFPDDRRFIVGTDVRPLRSGDLYLTVESVELEEPCSDGPPPVPAGATAHRPDGEHSEDRAAPAASPQRPPAARRAPPVPGTGPGSSP